MQGTPNTMQKNPKYKNVLLDIYDFFETSVNQKFKDKKIVLDPGIGFGKTLKHNLTLISKKYLCFIALAFLFWLELQERDLSTKYLESMIVKIEQEEH